MSKTAVVPKLSDEQNAAVASVKALLKKGNQVVTLGGFAGVGKTVVAAYLHQTYPEYAVAAYTGKAADVLRRKGLPGATIHSTIYTPRQFDGHLDFVLKNRSEVGCDGFIIDEASMVGTDLFKDLLSFDLPIIAIGDHGQLPPVGEDAGLMKNPNVRLETIHRNAGPIARFAEHLRKGGDARDWKADGRVVSVGLKKDVTPKHRVAADQIICAFNRSRVGLNRTVRRHLGRPEAPVPTDGDRVICLKNDRNYGVFNGQQGKVEEVNHQNGTMLFVPEFGEPIELPYDPRTWNAEKLPQDEGRWRRPGDPVPFDFAYAVTAHKFQGSEDDRILVYEERCQYWEHARWAYTAASRARTNLMWAV